MIESLPASNAEAEWKSEEDKRELERLRAEIRERLGADDRAKAVFECVCGGLGRNAQIAQALGMRENDVRSARRRVKRRIAELRREGVGEISEDGLTVANRAN
jgi:DNA-binding CsgD family transcriptional regulator